MAIIIATSLIGLIALTVVILIVLFVPIGGIGGIPQTIPSSTPATPSLSPQAIDAAAWHPYSGNIDIDANKLMRKEPIVAIYKTDTVLIDSIPSNAYDGLILVVYDDHTYMLFNRDNSTYKKGTWSGDPDNSGLYTLSSGTITNSPEKVRAMFPQFRLEIDLKSEGTPPHMDISYINFKVVDYYPLQPDTISKLNNKP